MSFEDFLSNWHEVEVTKKADFNLIFCIKIKFIFKIQFKICHLSAESFSDELQEDNDVS